ncbi:zeta toxin family protein [Streptomyces mirabilis]
MQTALDQCGGAVRVCRDLYKPAHRHYPGLPAANVRTAGVPVRPDTARWLAAVEARVRDRRFDAVSALADPDDFRGSSLAYRAAVHRIEVVVATAEALSQLGIVDRLLSEAVNGGGRYVSGEPRHVRAGPAGHAGRHRGRAVRRPRHRRTADGTVLYADELTPGGGRRRRLTADRRWSTAWGRQT